jgi:zona occludens toxin (predicted ATPase)
VSDVIEGIIGRPGSGKSYEATRRLMVAAESGRQCFANFGVSHPNVEKISMEDLLDTSMPSGLVVIDEAHLWFPSRLSMKLPPSVQQRMSQTRKAGQGGGFDLLWVTQHESRVDRTMRDITNWMWLCNSWLTWRGHPGFFTATCWEPEKFRKPKKQHGRYIHRFDRGVAECYDTYETLTVAKHVLDVADAYRDNRKVGSHEAVSARVRGGVRAGVGS